MVLDEPHARHVDALALLGHCDLDHVQRQDGDPHHAVESGGLVRGLGDGHDLLEGSDVCTSLAHASEATLIVGGRGLETLTAALHGHRLHLVVCCRPRVVLLKRPHHPHAGGEGHEGGPWDSWALSPLFHSSQLLHEQRSMHCDLVRYEQLSADLVDCGCLHLIQAFSAWLCHLE